jgi:hypothetical protein
VSIKIESKNVNQVVDLVVGFIASQAGLRKSVTQDVFREAFRLFFNSWINRGSVVEKIRDSKLFWFSVEEYRKKSETREFLKWFFAFVRLWIAILFRDIICVGARDKIWVKHFYNGAAARVDFNSRPHLIMRRSDCLRGYLKEYLTKHQVSAGDAAALSVALPEDLLEGCLFEIGLFLRIIPPQNGREICSEDLIENISSAGAVAVALHRGWQFTYKEHALPTLIFKNHFSIDYARVASRVVLTEDYAAYISEKEIREKCIWSRKTRRCRFKFDPNGKRVLCLPFISGMAVGMHWTGDSEFVKDLRYDARHLNEIVRAVRFVKRGEEALIRHHPCRCKGVCLEDFPRETFDGSGVKEAVFVGWTQGFFECRDAGVPTRIILTRPLSSLTDLGNLYIEELQSRGDITFLLTD